MSIDAELTQRLIEREVALARIAAEVARLEAARRQPDRWERACFVAAFQAFDNGLYADIGGAMDDARLPPSRRGAASPVPKGGIYDRADLTVIKLKLRVSRGEPVRHHPFGPPGG